MRTKQQRSFSEDGKAAWRAAKQQRLADLGEQLKQEVAAVQDSEAFKRYLAAQAVFHHYSARNVFLILYQRPEASRVAGYTSWQKLGRQVRRGESGITIFAPAPFKQTSTDATTGQVTEEIIPRFKTATVFDVAQTVGEPLPIIKLGEIVGSAPEGAYAVLVDFAASIGYTMVPHSEDDEAEGRCNYQDQTISVQTATPERMLHVLIHELAHALTAAIRQAHDRTERETIAEGVAFVVCTAVGLDAGGYAFPYIAGYAGQKDGAAIVTRLMDTIQKTAASSQHSSWRGSCLTAVLCTEIPVSVPFVAPTICTTQEVLFTQFISTSPERSTRMVLYFCIVFEYEVPMTTSALPADWPVMHHITTLRRHRQLLAERYHIDSLGVFGSYVRNEQHDGSDLDVLVTFAQTPSLFTLVALQDELQDLLGTPVDLVLKTTLKPRIGQHILREVVEI